uniref:RING-type E3 ubiquitin transferase n=1 Tax=Davidia involucrata TaxID=16924 RepID=A0A5B7BMS7_DAVIN
MGSPQTPTPPHLYSEALQIKLYQAFIFSIPILFSIILFLLFYLFYLKRRASTVSSPPPTLPESLNHVTPFASSSEMGLKGNLKEKLPIILFDEGLSTRDSQCCVCLGEFEMKEELHQVPSCKHVFHVDCIRHWLRSHSTCPLCRCSIVTTTHGHPEPQIVCPEHLVSVSMMNTSNYSREQDMVQLQMDGSSGGARTSISIENEMTYSNAVSNVHIHI